MLDDFLHEAKKVVQAKQARPGVAVHVRLGGNNSGDRDDRGVHAMDTANSYAVWAVTAGRDVSGVVRVACSEMAQTEVPRAAIQRAQVGPHGHIIVCRPGRHARHRLNSTWVFKKGLA